MSELRVHADHLYKFQVLETGEYTLEISNNRYYILGSNNSYLRMIYYLRRLDAAFEIDGIFSNDYNIQYIPQGPDPVSPLRYSKDVIALMNPLEKYLILNDINVKLYPLYMQLSFTDTNRKYMHYNIKYRNQQYLLQNIVPLTDLDTFKESVEQDLINNFFIVNQISITVGPIYITHTNMTDMWHDVAMYISIIKDSVTVLNS